MFVLIEKASNVVVSISENQFEIRPEFEWVEVSDDVEVDVSNIRQEDGSFADTRVVTLSDEEKAQIARASRDVLLAKTDFYGLSDQTMSDEIAAYRQALRDLPLQEGFPDVDFPVNPLDPNNGLVAEQ